MSVQATSWIELRAYRAPHPLDWSTPEKLVKSTVANVLKKQPGWVIVDKSRLSQECVQLTKALQDPYRSDWSADFKKFLKAGCAQPNSAVSLHPISHVSIHYSCRGEAERLISTTPRDTTLARIRRFRPLIFGPGGFDFVFKTVPGRWHESEELDRHYPLDLGLGQVHVARFLVPDEACENIKEFERHYRSLGLHQTYGSLISDPFFCEAGGCSLLTRSLLRVAGLSSPLVDSLWQRRLSIPAVLPHFVDLLLRAHPDVQWGSSSATDRDIAFYDPELMADAIENLAGQATLADWHAHQLFVHEGFSGQRSVVAIIDAREENLAARAELPKFMADCQNHLKERPKSGSL